MTDKPTYTYFDRGVAEAAEEAGGRYGRLHSSTVVTGAPGKPLPMPDWCRDPVPDEPLIDATDCGPVFGQALGGASSQPENNAPEERDGPLVPDGGSIP